MRQTPWYEQATVGRLPARSLDDRRDDTWDIPRAYTVRDLQAAAARELARQDRTDDSRDAVERAIREWMR